MTSDDVVAASGLQRRGLRGPARRRALRAGQRLNASILVQSLLVTPEEFADIPCARTPTDRSSRGGHRAHRAWKRDARHAATYNGRPAAALAIRQEAGANALDTADRIKAKMEELSRYFPPGVKAMYPSTRHRSSRWRSARCSRPSSRPSSSSSSSCTSSWEPPGDPHPHHRGPGRDPGTFGVLGSSATPSTC